MKINVVEFLESWSVMDTQTFAAVHDLLTQIADKKITLISDPEKGLEIEF